MITGFNTDVKHNTKVYHVQTEDKGRNNPKIETLVYVGGEILDTCRTSYEKSKSSLSEDEIMALLERQHKRVIRTIKIGKYDESVPFEEGLISDRSLDEVIKNYLEGEEPGDNLKLIAHGVSTLLREGSAELRLETKKLISNDPIERAEIRVKLVVPNQPMHFMAQGNTDSQGSLLLRIKLPAKLLDQASLIIQAISEWGTAEQKYPVKR